MQPSSHQVATCVLTNPPSIRGWIRVFAFVSARLSHREPYTSFLDIVIPTMCVEGSVLKIGTAEEGMKSVEV